jgi:CpeT protein
MRLPSASLVLLAAACASAPARSGQAVTSFVAADQAARLLVGRFDSAAQAASEPSYRAIQLTICRVNAPELGEHVLYLEQAQMDELEKPHRQRLYVVEARVPVATLVALRVYELRSPEQAVGFCARAGPQSFPPVGAEEKVGCAVQLIWDGKRFSGGTTGTACASSLRGAAYMTTQVVLDAVELRSWERGFDAESKQVWGADKGPYVFQRRTPVP